MMFLIPAGILLAFSLLSLASVAPETALNQGLFIVIGSLFFLVFWRIPYQLHVWLTKIYGFSGLIFLILPFIFGQLTRGSVRWIEVFGFTLQPSELIKPFLILIFSAFLAAKDRFSWQRLGIYSLLLLVPAFLIFKQPDLGSALVIGAFWLGIFWASKWPKTGLVLLFFFSLVFSPLAWKQLQPYQRQRITSFLNPYADSQSAGYHLIQSVISVGSGGWFGRGLGRGPQSQLKFLPEQHTDFIFSAWAEETGLVGSLAMLGTYFWLLSGLLSVSRQAPEEFGRLIGAGVWTMIFFQAVENIGMNLGLLPITGITLPLVSAGGSSILANAMALGIMANISGQSRQKNRLEIV